MLRWIRLLALSAVFLSAKTAVAQIEVYNNQINAQLPISYGFGGIDTIWDDLQLTQGGVLSSISLIAQPPVGATDQMASGVIDLRLYDETLGQPQGDPLATIPFSGTFETDPNDSFNRRLVIEVTDLESQNILLPSAGRVGAGISFDNTSQWFFPDAEAPEVGSSPGGYWLDNSSFERDNIEGLPWRVTVAGPGAPTYQLFETAKPTPTGPGGYTSGSVDSGFFRGTTFDVVRTTKLKQVGAWIGGTGTIFAAVVDLGSSQFNIPNPPDLSGDDVVATTLIELDGNPFTGKDVFGALDVTLEPGSYALLFGGGKFGADADADGLIRYGHIPNGDWPAWSIRQSNIQVFSTTDHSRVYAIAESAPGTIQIRPTFDVTAEVVRQEFSGTVESVRLVDGESMITADQPEAITDPNLVPVLEFPLADVPADSNVVSATLELDLLFSDSNAQFEVLGYAGDGTAGIGDAADHIDVVGITDISGTGVVSIEIDPAFVESLIGSASHLGLVIEPNLFGSFGFGTLEGGQFYDAPLLTLGLSDNPRTGDFDFDGDIDGQDFLAWQRGESSNPLSAADLADWQGEYSAGAASALATSSKPVPEPTNFTLQFAAACALLIMAPFRRSHLVVTRLR